MAGQTRPFIKRIETQMYAASEAQDYERAARLRDDLGAPWSKALEKQAVVLGDGADADVIALAEDPLEVAVQIFYVRGGRIRGQRGWVADRVDRRRHRRAGRGLPPAALRRRRRHASRARSWCRSCRREATTFEELLSDLRGSRVQIRVPQRGDKKSLQETVARNAGQALALHKTKRASDLTTRNRALEEIQQALRPRRGAAADRVLRRLQPPGHRGGRLDGGLRGRPGPQERVPPVRDPRRRRARTTWRRCTR